MSLYKRFKTNSDAANNGIELDFGDGVVLTVARAHTSNKKYVQSLEKHLGKDLASKLKKETSIKESLDKLAVIFAESVVLGWQGVTDEAGVEMPFTVENCVKLFKDLPDFFEQVIDLAKDHENFLESRISEYQNNLKND